MSFRHTLIVLSLLVSSSNRRTNAASQTEKLEVHLLCAADLTRVVRSRHVYVNTVTMAIDDINKREDVLPGVTLVPHFMNSKCSMGDAVNTMYSYLYQTPAMPIIIGPTCSDVCKSMASTSINWHVNIISNVCVDPALSDTRKYPRFFRATASEEETVPTRMELLKEFNWNKISLLHEPVGPFPKVTEAMLRKLDGTNVTVLSMESVGNDPKQQIRSLMEKDARIVVGGVYPNTLPKFLCEVYKMGFYGSHITWIMTGYYDEQWPTSHPESHDCSPADLWEATQDVLYTDTMWINPVNTPSFTGRTQEELDQLVEDWQANVTEKAGSTYLAATYYDSVLAAALALNYTQERLRISESNKTLADFTYTNIEMADLITEGFNKTAFQGIKGYIQFDENGDYPADGIIFQQKGEEKRYVGWHKKTENKIVWMNGGITWRKGKPPVDSTVVEFQTVYVSNYLYIVICCLAAVGVLVSIAFLAFNSYYRNLRVIKMSSPNINTLILVGCIVAYISVVFEMGESTRDSGGVFCALRTDVFIIGFSVSFGGLFSKTWRVHVILTRSIKTAKTKIISDTKLYLIVGAIVLVDLLVLITWHVYDPYRVEMKNITMETSNEQLYEKTVVIHQVPSCTSDYKVYFQGALFVFQGAMLAFGAFLAWETRKVKLAALNDSKLIGICIYNVAILSIIGAAISMVITDNPDATYGFSSAFLLAGTTLTTTVLFLPKIMIKHRGEVEPADGGTGNTGNAMSNSIERTKTSGALPPTSS